MKYFKQTFTIMMITILAPFYAISQQYHPFPEQNTYWTVVEFNQQYYYWDTYIYTVKGDTVLNNKPYKKIWQLDDIPGSHDTLWVLHSFMRQDTLQKKVWFIRHYMNDTTEKLGYDFDVQIGDTVYLPAFDYENIGDSIFLLIDPGTDSTLLRNGEYRKNFSFRSLYPNSGWSFYVIEGVGTQQTPFPNLFYFDPFHQSELVCHKVNGIYLYGASPLPDECGFTVNINEILQTQTVAVKPNPCNNYFDIQLPENIKTELNIQLINTFGKVVLLKKAELSEKEISINTSSFSNGLYILNIYSSNKNLLSNKIIINH